MGKICFERSTHVGSSNLFFKLYDGGNLSMHKIVPQVSWENKTIVENLRDVKPK